ncbi:hypothetical protein KSC_071630 [Ktedonobacter sp. SOSP1-52]|nr:hypothetical protein KSC_071630 [Ktedonobacter sp. SOSP1-52]
MTSITDGSVTIQMRSEPNFSIPCWCSCGTLRHMMLEKECALELGKNATLEDKTVNIRVDLDRFWW